MENTNVNYPFILTILSHFAFVLFLMSIIAIFLTCLIKHKKPTANIIYTWIALLPLGITGIYTGSIHAFFPEISAESIGWPMSPFQWEVGMADLALGILALLSIRASVGFKLATVILAVIFLWGDALGHVYQMLFYQNFTVGNAGSWFWMDVLLPIILIICIKKIRV